MYLAPYTCYKPHMEKIITIIIIINPGRRCAASPHRYHIIGTYIHTTCGFPIEIKTTAATVHVINCRRRARSLFSNKPVWYWYIIIVVILISHFIFLLFPLRPCTAAVAVPSFVRLWNFNENRTFVSDPELFYVY